MRHNRLACLIAACMIFPFASASADVIWGNVLATAPTPSTPEHAVVLTPNSTGTHVTGTVYTLAGTQSVWFSTNNEGSCGIDHLFAFSGSELRSNEPNDPDTSIDQITITVPPGEAGDIYLNLYGLFNGTSTADFMVTTSAGT